MQPTIAFACLFQMLIPLICT